MSTMRVTNLKHENSASNNIVLNSDGSVGGDLATTLASKLDLAGGKILQIVRATDGTSRNTTSTSYVDVTGMSVTITPQKSTSAIIVIAIGLSQTSSTLDTQNYTTFAITDNSNNTLSGAERMFIGHSNFTGSGTRNVNGNLNLWGYSTPATTSATTYKLRFKTDNASQSTGIRNDLNTGQMYAIEVSA